MRAGEASPTLRSRAGAHAVSDQALDGACAVRFCAGQFSAGAERIRSSWRRLSQVRNSQRRSGGLRDALRAGLALPCLELFLSANRKRDCGLLAEEPRARRASRTNVASPAFVAQVSSSRARDRWNIPSTASAATIAVLTFRQILPARLAWRHAQRRTNAAHGLMCGLATFHRRRAAISRKRSRRRGKSRAASRESCGSSA